MSNQLRMVEEPFIPEALLTEVPIKFPTDAQSYFLYKRIVDVFVCTLTLLFCLPLFFAIALMIKLDSPGPILFRQKRVGVKTSLRNGRLVTQNYLFSMYKFRTMYHNASDDRHRKFIKAYIDNNHKEMAKLQNGELNGSNQYKLVGDPRITRAGAFLRKTSLDELPQILNVLQGHMSLVGPRPAIPYEVEIYEPWHRKRLQSTPGITGLWQITARSSTSFDEMVRLDIQYTEIRTLKLDLLILLKTPLEVIKGEGAQ